MLRASPRGLELSCLSLSYCTSLYMHSERYIDLTFLPRSLSLLRIKFLSTVWIDVLVLNKILLHDLFHSFHLYALNGPYS